MGNEFVEDLIFEIYEQTLYSGSIQHDMMNPEDWQALVKIISDRYSRFHIFNAH